MAKLLAKLQILKLLKQHRRSLLIFLGLIGISAAMLAGQHVQTQSQSSPTPSPISLASTSPAAVVPTPSLAPGKPFPAPQASSTGKLPQSKPALTKEQAEINRKAKESFQTTTASVDTFVEMHVAIAEGSPSLTISTTGANLMDKDGKLLQQLPANQNFTIQPNGKAISFGSWQLPETVWIDPGINGVFALGNRNYRGQLLLVSGGDRLWAVNYVNLRQYLYSVVGSEVSPSWSMEALKAQAVAARSYALTYYFRPMNSLFHLGATEYYQVYSGMQGEAARTRQAVDATAGEYVSYKGGVVESLYAASDDIVAEAFQGKGMSQLGALGLAEQGYSYTRILGHYYPGTAVARIKQYYE
jgi:stage II sporulation protein D